MNKETVHSVKEKSMYRNAIQLNSHKRKNQRRSKEREGVETSRPAYNWDFKKQKEKTHSTLALQGVKVIEMKMEPISNGALCDESLLKTK